MTLRLTSKFVRVLDMPEFQTLEKPDGSPVTRGHVREELPHRAVPRHQKMDGLLPVTFALVFFENKDPDLAALRQINSADEPPRSGADEIPRLIRSGFHEGLMLPPARHRPVADVDSFRTRREEPV